MVNKQPRDPQDTVPHRKTEGQWLCHRGRGNPLLSPEHMGETSENACGLYLGVPIVLYSILTLEEIDVFGLQG